MTITNRQALAIQSAIETSLQTSRLNARVFLRFRQNADTLRGVLKYVQELMDQKVDDEILTYRKKIKALRKEQPDFESFSTELEKLNEEYKEAIEKYEKEVAPILDETFTGKLLTVKDTDFGDDFIFYDALESLRPIVVMTE